MRSRLFRFGLAGALALTGCTALLDVKDIFLQADAGGVDGSLEGSTTVEGGGGEGGPDGSTCVANLATDAKNCGRCGHDCVGGACTAGVCQPVLLADGLGGPTGIALGPNDVYFTATNSALVASVSKKGGSVTSLASNEKDARGVAVSGTTVYWGNGDFKFDGVTYKGGIWKCTITGCNTNKSLLTAADFGAAPTIHGSALYLAAQNASEVYGVPLAGGTATKLATTNHPFTLAADDTHVYYNSNQYTPYRALVDGGSVGNEQEFGPRAEELGYLVIDDQRVYWPYTEKVSASDGGSSLMGHVISVMKTPLGSAPISYGSPADSVFPVGVAVDKDYVYWSTDGNRGGGNPAGDGKVFACRKSGCQGAPILLATGLLQSGPVAVDEAAVYWVEFGTGSTPDGRVRKVARP